MQIKEDNPPREVAQISDQLNKLVSGLIQSAAIAAGKAGAVADGHPDKSDRFSVTYAAAVGCVSALHVLASILGHHGDKERNEVKNDEIAKLINPTSTLLAALLVQSMCPSASNEGESGNGVLIGQNIEFGNEIILDAVQQVERITGRPVDGHVSPFILAQVRQIADGSDEPMNRFLAQRRPTPGNLH